VLPVSTPIDDAGSDPRRLQGPRSGAVPMKPRERPSCAHSVFGALVACALPPSADKAASGPNVSRHVLGLVALG
jgi:hypothetical protein